MIIFLLIVLVILIGILAYSIYNNIDMKKILDRQDQTIKDICRQLDIDV